MGLKVLLIYTLFSVNYFCISAQFCTSPYDLRCNSEQVCCNSECVYGSDCSGYYCSSDSDCTLNEYCCDNTCSDSTCSNYDVIIGVAVSVGFGIFFLCIFLLCCRYRRNQRTIQRPILGQRVTTRVTTTTTTRRQNYRPVPNYPQQGPYQGPQPCGYQQGYVQPPAYPGYGATNPIAGAYQSGSNIPPPTSVAQPPPYEEVPAVVALEKGNTDQKNNYSQASAPPM